MIIMNKVVNNNSKMHWSDQTNLQFCGRLADGRTFDVVKQEKLQDYFKTT